MCCAFLPSPSNIFVFHAALLSNAAVTMLIMGNQDLEANYHKTDLRSQNSSVTCLIVQST